jgi:hypothetical protein
MPLIPVFLFEMAPPPPVAAVVAPVDVTAPPPEPPPASPIPPGGTPGASRALQIQRPMVVMMRPPQAFSPGPPRSAPRDGGKGIQVFGEVFARYAHERWNEQAARSFDIPRARLGADAVLRGPFAARVLIETVRSAAPGSLYGVDGDSIVLRAREIYGEARSPEVWPVNLRLRLGLLPTLAITPLEQMWGRRVVAPTAQEASTLLSPADLGAALLVSLPHQLGEVALAVVNGEGFTQHEQNEGKNVQARLWLTPLDTLLPPSLSVKVLAHAEDGSQGPTQARADRYVGGLSVEHTHGAIGVDGTFANGAYGNSGQFARTASAWVRVGPFSGLEAVGRVDQIDPNRRSNGGDDRVTAWQGGIGYHGELEPGPTEQTFELFLTYRHSNGGPLARASDPRQPQRGPRLDLKVSF